MIKIVLIFSLVSLLSFFQINSCGTREVPKNKNVSNTEENNKKPEDSKINKIIDNKETKFQTIRELNKEKPMKGNFDTRGYVVKITDCPACPPDSQCKPCMAENIVISEVNRTLDTYELTDKDLIIFTKESENFAIGVEYRFKIKITDKKTTSANLNDVELISFDSIKN